MAGCNLLYNGAKKDPGPGYFEMHETPLSHGQALVWCSKACRTAQKYLYNCPFESYKL
jgi:hypothetical protein